METKQILMNELDAFFSLKINKSSGYDDISFNVLKMCFSSLFELWSICLIYESKKGFPRWFKNR